MLPHRVRRPGSGGNEPVLCVPQSSSTTEGSLSDCFVSFQDIRWGCLTPLHISSRCILQPQPTGLTVFSVISRTLVVGVGITSLHISSRCILQPQPTGLTVFSVIFRTLIVGVGITPLHISSRSTGQVDHYSWSYLMLVCVAFVLLFLL